MVQGWIEIHRSRDYALLWRIATSPEIYRATSDDYSPSPRMWKIAEREDFVYLLAQRDEEILGFVAFYPVNGVTYEAHLCFLAKGEVNQLAFKLMLVWMWQNTRAQRICGGIPGYNRLAANFVERCGFDCYGKNPRSWQKDGKLYDLELWGISRPAAAPTDSIDRSAA